MAAPSINSSRAMAIIRREPGFRYCLPAMKSMQAPYRLHKKASGFPRLAFCVSRWGDLKESGHAIVGSGRRHQHGIDHMNDAVGLVDVGDRDHRSVALGVDDPGLAVGLLHRQLFAFGRLDLVA